MRREDRQVTDTKEIIGIMERCDVCRLAFNDGDYPYILPLNFGIQIADDRLYLVFHGALEGTKYDIIERDGRASFEMDCGHTLFSDESRGYCTMMYESVIGRGRIEYVPDNGKQETLEILCNKYHKEGFAFNPAAIPRTKVFRLAVEEMTGKVKS